MGNCIPAILGSLHPALTDMVSAMTPGSIEEEPQLPTPMQNAGVYLKDLRRARRLTQSDLAEVVEVGRGTIERLESGDDRISVGTVLQVLKILGASPCHYY